MKCPRCEVVELVMSDRQGVEIDYCRACRGVWLDKDELDKIIDRVAQFGNAPIATERPPTPTPSTGIREEERYRESYTDRDRDRDWDRDRDRDRDGDRGRYRDDDRYGKRRRKEGFLENLFDVFD